MTNHSRSGVSGSCDHLDSRQETDISMDGDTQALVVRDAWSKLRDIYPAKSKGAVDTEKSIADFLGSRKAKRSFHQTMYSDQEESIKLACKNLKLRAEFSQAGVPRNNAVIERTIGDILEGSRVLLRTAGLPVCSGLTLRGAIVCCRTLVRKMQTTPRGS